MKGLFFFISLICFAQIATAQRPGITGTHLLVYKTKKNYNKLVPVILSENRSKIVSYPDPTDIKKKGNGNTPVSLHNGYLLTNNGIGIYTAFLDMSFTRYAAQKTSPSVDKLYRMIKEKDPLTALYDCGLKGSNSVSEQRINRLIDKKQLADSCKTLLLK